MYRPLGPSTSKTKFKIFHYITQFQLLDFYRLFLVVCMCVLVCLGMRAIQVLEEVRGVTSHGAGIPGNCEPSDVGFEN